MSSNQPLFISKELAKYIKEKYEVDIDNDNRITCCNHDPMRCTARCWAQSSDYAPRYGGISDRQCSLMKFKDSQFCEYHNIQYSEGKLSFGIITEDPPEQPVIVDIEGNKTRYYWINQCEGHRKDEIFMQQEEEKQENYSKRRGRGRPPTKKVLYKEIEREKLYSEGKIDSLSLSTLKEYLQKNNLYLYGKKSEIVTRICEHISRVD